MPESLFNKWIEVPAVDHRPSFEILSVSRVTLVLYHFVTSKLWLFSMYCDFFSFDHSSEHVIIFSAPAPELVAKQLFTWMKLTKNVPEAVNCLKHFIIQLHDAAEYLLIWNSVSEFVNSDRIMVRIAITRIKTSVVFKY